ncbi:MAG: alpha/beta fold hydrolase [Acidimicrobiales bacterium]
MSVTPLTPARGEGAHPIHVVAWVAGVALAVDRRGAGAPVLLIHGGGEDASMLARQAESLAAAGFEAITYDRRGTGRSGRAGWPVEAAAEQHAADAAALIEALGLHRPTVVGVSSGGVIALKLAALRPDAVGAVLAWEPPAAGLLPGGDEVTAEIMAPVHEHLARRPGDFAGAQALLLTAILGVPVAADDPAFAAARANAEPMVRDEPTITRARFDADDLRGRPVTIAVGDRPNEVVAASAAALAGLTGADPVRVEADHEVYLYDPSVLTRLLTS